MPVRTLPEVLHASADIAIATFGAGLVLLVFYPITVCAAGVKGVVRMVHPSAGERQRRQSLAPR